MQIWDRMRAEGAPSDTWKGHVASHVRAIHEALYGEDGKGEGEGEQPLGGCTIVKSTSLQYRHTSSLTGATCMKDYLYVDTNIYSIGAWNYYVCSNCSLAYAAVVAPTQHGYYFAVGRHEWGYPARGATTFDEGWV